MQWPVSLAVMDPAKPPTGLRSPAARRRSLLLSAIGVTGALLAASPAGEGKPGGRPSVTASFSVAPAAPLSGQAVTFTSTSTVTGNKNAIVDHRWDLDGDGSLETATGTTPSASRAYPQPGTLRVSLQVTDARGQTAEASALVVIGNRLPTASFSYAPAAPAVYDPVTFTSRATDPEGQIADLKWDLNGDGTYDNGRGPRVLRTFNRPGSFVVGLEAIDAAGGVAFFSRTINVAPLSRPSQPGQPEEPLSQGSAQKLGPRLMNPFPLVRIAGRITGHGTLVRLLRIDAPVGAKVAIRCRGRGCPFSNQVRLASRVPHARSAQRVRVRRLERLLPPGVIVRVFITSPDLIGKYTRFRMRRGKPPARVDRCLNPGSLRPVECPIA